MSQPQLPEPKVFPTLYKSSSKGKEQQWVIQVHPYRGGAGDEAVDEVWADIVTMHGQVGGAQQTARVVVDKGKNLGRANATTAYEQAVSEAESKWKKQQDKGYSTERGGGSMELLPMLAHKYHEKKKKVVFPAFLQPKLDGFRALAVRKGDTILLMSRGGKEHKYLDHIRAALLTMMADGEVWDGELYFMGHKDGEGAVDFQDLSSLIKRPQAGSEKVEYHVYDRVAPGSFDDRHEPLIDAIPEDGPVKYVETVEVNDHDHVEQLHAEFVEEGYEGAMLRWGEAEYKSGYRSENLLKVKAFDDDEFEVVDVVPSGVGKEADKGKFVCRTKDGATFNAKPKGRDEVRAEYLANKHKYIGKKLTVEFFGYTTSDPPVPRFPVGKAIRED